MRNAEKLAFRSAKKNIIKIRTPKGKSEKEAFEEASFLRRDKFYISDLALRAQNSGRRKFELDGGFFLHSISLHRLTYERFIR